MIDNGHIVESGSHEQLLAAGGYYADLQAVQSSQDADRARKAKLLSDLEDRDALALSTGGGA